jgi:hypothetical protein
MLKLYQQRRILPISKSGACFVHRLFPVQAAFDPRPQRSRPRTSARTIDNRPKHALQRAPTANRLSATEHFCPLTATLPWRDAVPRSRSPCAISNGSRRQGTGALQRTRNPVRSWQQWLPSLRQTRGSASLPRFAEFSARERNRPVRGSEVEKEDSQKKEENSRGPGGNNRRYS